MSKLKTTLLIAVVVLLGLFISSQTMAAVCNVPIDRPTIQAAVTDVTCDPINVAAGVFTETGQIVINRNLTISGAGAGSTVIKPANDTICCSNGPSDAWIYVSPGITFNLNNVTLDGSGKQIHHAIQSRGLVTVQECDIKNIRYDIHRGIGIRLVAGSSNLVKDCTFSNIERIGVHVRGSVEPTNPVATIDGCTYIGKGASFSLDYAIEAGAGGKATITNSFISNCGPSSSGWGSAGILATDYYGAGTEAVVTNNNITSCEYGIAVGYLDTDVTTVTANNNNIFGNTVGVDNVSTVVVTDAKNNWWGSSSGPQHSGNPGGTGDPVSDNVYYIPWLTEPLPLPLEYWKDYNGEDPGGYMPDIDQNQDFDKSKIALDFDDNDEGVETMPGFTSFIIAAYSPGVGYGWDTTANIDDRKRASGNALQKDLHFSSQNRTFKVDLPNGTYNVTVYIGDGQSPHDNIDVSAEGVLMLDNVSITGGEFKEFTFSVTVSDSQLDLLFHDDGGTDPNWVVNGIEITKIEQEYCAPVAEANSLWWLDKKYENIEIFANPLEGTGYVGGDFNQDSDGVGGNILDLVQELAIMMKTNQGHTGTTVLDQQAGIDAFLEKYNLSDKLYEHTAYDGEYETCQEYFTYLEDEVKRCQDVKLDLGFWHVEEVSNPGAGWDNDGDGNVDEDPPDGIDNDEDGRVDEDGIIQDVVWKRWGGHAVTVAGVDSPNFLFAISDPDNDAAEAGLNPGLVRTPLGSIHPYPHEPALHNDENYASHDIYAVGPSPSPGGKCGLPNYPWKMNLPPEEQIVAYKTYEPPLPLEYCMVFTEIEAAVIVSPIECGNGNVDPGEECDDGNTNNGDGCDDQCKIPDISVSPSSLAFGKVTPGSSSISKTVTVKNDGNGKLKIGTSSNPTITIGGTNPDQFSITTDNCSGQLIAPSSTCTVDVKFSPTATGAKTASLDIPSDDPDENSVSVTLKGNAVKVKVTSPNGGESWKSADGGYAITWQTSTTIAPAVATTKILYTMNGGTSWKTITTLSGPTPGTYTWYIPKVTVTMNKCKVKVVLKNAANTTIGSDMSDKVFKITP